MGNPLENGSYLEPHSLEAVDRIVSETAEKYEDTEAGELVLEKARNKFRILFKEGSLQYQEAESRLLRAVEPKRTARLERDMEEMPAIVAGVSKKLLRGGSSTVMSGVLMACNSQEQLEHMYNGFNLLIDNEVTANLASFKPPFPYFKGLQTKLEFCRLARPLKERLESLYLKRKQELEAQGQ